MTRTARLFPLFVSMIALGACSGGVDFDLRGKMGGRVDTSQAAIKATTARPAPDNRGVISYPSYQVAVAKRGDKLSDVANRLGLPAEDLARFNGIKVDDPLRQGELIALPRRVSEPSPATGAATTGPIRPAPTVDVATLAGNAIDRAAPTAPRTATGPTGIEPIRHQVARGETAFTIARLYNVSPRALAEWNGLDKAFNIREGQFLLIPPVDTTAPQIAEPAVSEPGDGTPTPTPPSASKPLPTVTPPAAASVAATTLPKADAKPAAPAKPVADIGQSKPAASSAQMVMPVSGSIIREYSRERNPGIDISATAGSPVKAAASGQVIAISTTTEGVKFILIRHPADLVSVYTHVDDVKVAKGDAVSKGQDIARVRSGEPAFLHFEVRQGMEPTDPMPYLR
ncbi:LysM peptidoglycan-binding domain-containing M23 family metallopeptidase [Tropicibacter naphthalenivorans]|uniref:Murein hydrolase activator NlpD n=1 Tax=Tropicibacter naphthalenivorans TaxID=441103 RepID=A0A0N7LZ88_9RHOB|nr:LysM peptidoglycan-binding domain-containing M23 family metallopeptidase [Tropicibacter naphthalenivorans]CUH76985.1 Murein hydrolase activator NlpD precursor [Tropicibacter naphthalenivorans]SMC61813.1 Murein DD-endopeptidase MepM and murein hydrolase activator NlpD, contain LysM domain [Tropicibacter naphthalenivorans]